MDFKTAVGLFDEIRESTKGDDRLTGLRSDLLLAAVRYARIRTDYQLASLEEKRDMEETRTRNHNALIDAANILSRNSGIAGRENSWRLKMTDNRKVIGDWACMVHAHLGILAR